MRMCPKHWSVDATGHGTRSARTYTGGRARGSGCGCVLSIVQWMQPVTARARARTCTGGRWRYT